MCRALLIYFNCDYGSTPVSMFIAVDVNRGLEGVCNVCAIFATDFHIQYGCGGVDCNISRMHLSQSQVAFSADSCDRLGILHQPLSSPAESVCDTFERSVLGWAKDIFGR